MGLPAERGIKGLIFFEALIFVTIYVAGLGGMHLAMVKYWNHRLEKLQKTRLPYDGVQKTGGEVEVHGGE